MRTLRCGCRGNDVMWLQYLIGADMDSSFGPATDRALRAKQRVLGLAAAAASAFTTERVKP